MILPLLRRFGLLFALTFAIAPLALAQEAESDEPGDRATSFQNVSGPQVEDVPGGALMVGAYGAAFVLLVLYVWRLGTLQRNTASEVEALRQTIDNATRALRAKGEGKE